MVYFKKYNFLCFLKKHKHVEDKCFTCITPERIKFINKLKCDVDKQ